MIINCIEATNVTDYSNKKLVKKSNKAAKRMSEIAKLMNLNYPSRIDDFAKLLKCTNNKTDLWVAHQILEDMTYSTDLEQKCLDVIIKYSKEDSVTGLGNRMWLKDWYKKKKE